MNARTFPHMKWIFSSSNSSMGILLWMLILLIAVSSCKIADLRTTTIDPLTPEREKKAVDLLEKAIQSQRLDILARATTYSYQATDNWKGLMALFNPFPKDNEIMEMRFRPQSFDSQFNYRDAENPKVYGVQSFHYYEIKEKETPKFRNKKSLRLALPAVPYLFELPLRLREAPILKYAGTKTVEGASYHLVFATWESLEPNRDFDQYLLYLSQDTGLLTFANYTVRNAYLPTPRNIYGTIRYEDHIKNDDGILYPSTLSIQINRLKKNHRWAHRMRIGNLELNSFDLLLLYPNKDLNFLGDAKK